MKEEEAARRLAIEKLEQLPPDLKVYYSSNEEQMEAGKLLDEITNETSVGNQLIEKIQQNRWVEAHL